MSDLDDLITEAEDILAHAEETPFRPVIMLELLVALAKEFRAMRPIPTNGTIEPRCYTDADHQVWSEP